MTPDRRRTDQPPGAPPDPPDDEGRIARAPEDLERGRDAAAHEDPLEHAALRLVPGAHEPEPTQATGDEDESLDPHSIALPEPPLPPRRRIAAALSIAALAIAAFATGLFVFNNLVMPRFIHVNAEVRVPDLTNLTIERAEKQVSALDLQISRAGERFDPSVPSGFILTQDPPEGTPVRGRRRISVIVSLGEEYSSVPELFGESQRGARLLLERAGLHAGGISHAPSDEAGEGLVVSSDPSAEAVLSRGSEVSLLISTGAGRDEYVMPELLGRELTGVRRQLEAIGCRVVVPAGASGSGGIVFQNPAPGARITHDATITLQAMGRLIR